MNILIACEFSGIVRDAFIAKGHNAISCDLLPTERPGPHIQDDVSLHLNEGWDMMIAHPPCTHLSVSGARWFEQKRIDGRQQQGIDFFTKLAAANIAKIAIENPIGIMSKIYRKPDQIVHPYWFGDSVQKATCFWLKNLSLLIATNIVDRGLIYVDRRGNKHDGQFTMRAKRAYSPLMLLPHNSDRWKIRSVTFPGIAAAMAEQWG